jgi:hypothetical protein
MPFTAQYPGVCADDTCGMSIRPGDEVQYVNGSLVHVRCPEQLTDLTPREQSAGRCPRCTGHHAGEC